MILHLNLGPRALQSALAVVGEHIRLRGRDLRLAHNPLPGAPLYRGVLHDWAQDKPARLEVCCFSKLSGEGKQLKKKGSIKGKDSLHFHRKMSELFQTF